VSSERRSRGRGLEELYLCRWYREAERGESDVEVLFPFATDSLASLPTSTMAAYPVSSLGPASTPSLSPAKIIASISPSPRKSSSSNSSLKLLAILVFLAFFLLRLFTFYLQHYCDPTSSNLNYPSRPPSHPTIGISLSRTCSEAGYEPFEIDFRHNPSEASPTWKRIPWPKDSPWYDQEGALESGSWCKRGGVEMDWEMEDWEVSSIPAIDVRGRNANDADRSFCLRSSLRVLSQVPDASEISRIIVERMEHASAFLEKTVTRAVVSVPSGLFLFLSSRALASLTDVFIPSTSSWPTPDWSFEILEHLRRDLPSVLPSNLKVSLQQHHISALQLLPLPSPRWITRNNDTWTSSILVVDAAKEWGNTTLSLLRMRDDGYDVMGVRSLIADRGSYEEKLGTQITSWEPEELGRKLDVLLSDVKVGRTRPARVGVDVVSVPSFLLYFDSIEAWDTLPKAGNFSLLSFTSSRSSSPAPITETSLPSEPFSNPFSPTTPKPGSTPSTSLLKRPSSEEPLGRRCLGRLGRVGETSVP